MSDEHLQRLSRPDGDLLKWLIESARAGKTFREVALETKGDAFLVIRKNPKLLPTYHAEARTLALELLEESATNARRTSDIEGLVEPFAKLGAYTRACVQAERIGEGPDYQEHRAGVAQAHLLNKLAHIAGIAQENGDYASAKETTNSLRRVRRRFTDLDDTVSLTYIHRTEGAARRRDYTRVRRLAREAGTCEKQALDLAALAAAENRDYDVAKKYARGDYRPALAKKAAENGDYEIAEQLVQQSPNTPNLDFAEAAARNGDFERAVKYAATGPVSTSLVESCVKQGRYDLALSFAERDAPWQYYTIAQAAARKGDIAIAQNMMQRFPTHAGWRREVVGDMAFGHAKRREYEAAERIRNENPDQRENISTLIVSAAARNFDIQEARNLAITGGLPLSDVDRSLSLAYSDIGDIGPAIVYARNIATEHPQYLHFIARKVGGIDHERL